MSTETTQATPDTSIPAPQSAPATEPVQQESVVATPSQTPVPQPTGLEFLPEAYRNNPSFAKYKSADDFYKGFENLQKLVGQKQVVNGIQPPGENATEEDYNNFYKAIGRPEAPDKYNYGEDLKAFEGFDLDGEKKNFSELAFKHGLSQKQADGLFKEYLNKANADFTMSQQQVQAQFDQAVLKAFGTHYQQDLDKAKRGAKALGNADKLTLEELRDPLTLKALAKLGEYVGEDTFLEGNSTETKESVLAEAERIQASEAYKRGDKTLHAQVDAMYRKVYG